MFTFKANTMHFRNINFILIVLGFSLLSANGQTDSVTLGECLKKSREYHPSFSDSQRINDTRELKIRNIQSSWLPQAGLNAQATYQSDANG
jgi:hypothetical protein